MNLARPPGIKINENNNTKINNLYLILYPEKPSSEKDVYVACPHSKMKNLIK